MLRLRVNRRSFGSLACWWMVFAYLLLGGAAGIAPARAAQNSGKLTKKSKTNTHFIVDYTKHGSSASSIAREALDFYDELASICPNLLLDEANIQVRMVLVNSPTVRPNFSKFLGGSYYDDTASRYALKEDVVFLRRQDDPADYPFFAAGLRETLTRVLVHKVMAGQGVAKPEAAAWAIQGLAAYVAGVGSPGLERVHQRSRRLILFSLMDAKKLPPLAKFLTVSNADFEKYSTLQRVAFRAQAWGVFHYFVEMQPDLPGDPLVQILARFDRRDAAAVNDFRGFIATPEVFEKDWRRFLVDLKTLRFRKPGQQASPLVKKSPRSTAKAVQKFLRAMAEKVEGRGQAGVRKKFLWRNQAQLAPAVRTFMKRENGDRRVMAIVAAAELGDRTVLPLLKKYALKDKNPDVRQEAALAVGQLNYGIAPEAFIAGLRSRSVERVRRAAVALGRVGDVYAMVPLVTALRRAGTRQRRVDAAVGVGSRTGTLGGYSVSGGGSVVPTVGGFNSGSSLTLTTAQEKLELAQETLLNVLRKLAPKYQRFKRKGWLDWQRNR